MSVVQARSSADGSKDSYMGREGDADQYRYTYHHDGDADEDRDEDGFDEDEEERRLREDDDDNNFFHSQRDGEEEGDTIKRAANPSNTNRKGVAAKSSSADITPFTTEEEIESVLDERFPYPPTNRIKQMKLDYYLNSVRGPIFPSKYKASAKAFLYATHRLAGTEAVARERLEKGFRELLMDWRPHMETLKQLHQRDRREVFQQLLREEKFRAYVEEEAKTEWEEEIARPLLTAQLFYEKGGLHIEDLPILKAFEDEVEGEEREFLNLCEEQERGELFNSYVDDMVSIEQREEERAFELHCRHQQQRHSSAAASGVEGGGGFGTPRSASASSAQHQHQRHTQHFMSNTSVHGGGQSTRSQSLYEATGHVGAPYNVAPLSADDLKALRNSRSSTPNPTLNPYAYVYDRTTGSVSNVSQTRQRREGSASSPYSRASSASANHSSAYNRWAENSLQLFSHSHHKSDRTFAADYVAHSLVANRVRMRDLGDARRADAAETNRIVAQRTREENMVLREALEAAKRRELQRCFAHVIKSRDEHKNQRKLFDAAREAYQAQRRRGASTRYMAYKWDLHTSKIPEEGSKLDELMGITHDPSVGDGAGALVIVTTSAGDSSSPFAGSSPSTTPPPSRMQKERSAPSGQQSFLSPTARSASNATHKSNSHNNNTTYTAADGGAHSPPPSRKGGPHLVFSEPTSEMHRRAIQGLAPLPPYVAPAKVVFGQQRPPTANSAVVVRRKAPEGGRLDPLPDASGGEVSRRPQTAAAMGNNKGIPLNSSNGGTAATQNSNGNTSLPPRSVSAGANRGYYFTNLPVAADGSVLRGGGGERSADASALSQSPEKKRQAPKKKALLPTIIHPVEAKLVQVAQCYAAMLKSSPTPTHNDGDACDGEAKSGGGGQANHARNKIIINIKPSPIPTQVLILQPLSSPSNANAPTSNKNKSVVIPNDVGSLLSQYPSSPAAIDEKGSLYERAAWRFAKARALIASINNTSNHNNGGDDEGASITATAAGDARGVGGQEQRQQAKNDAIFEEADRLLVEGEAIMSRLERGGWEENNVPHSHNTDGAPSSPPPPCRLLVYPPSLLSEHKLALAHVPTMHQLHILRGKAKAAVLRASRQLTLALRALEEVAKLESIPMPIAPPLPPMPTPLDDHHDNTNEANAADETLSHHHGDGRRDAASSSSSPPASPRSNGGTIVHHPETAPFQPNINTTSVSPLRGKINPHNDRRESILMDYSKGVRGGTFARTRKPIGDGDKWTRAAAAEREKSRMLANRSPPRSPREGRGDASVGSTSLQQQGTSSPANTIDHPPSSSSASQTPPNPITLVNIASISAALASSSNDVSKATQTSDAAVAYGRKAGKAVTRQLEANIAAIVAAINAKDEARRREAATSDAPQQATNTNTSSRSDGVGKSNGLITVDVPIPYPDALEMAVSTLTTIAAAQLSQPARPQSGMSVKAFLPSERSSAPTTYRLALGLARDTLSPVAAAAVGGGGEHPMVAYCQRCVDGIAAKKKSGIA